ncbi:titin [Misgurnus anguillicaudatus]|uniref:titin n=1 Tax=Misgurnus anguillicaudatus TaxID=75329 RepID=UPI003CCFBF5F
MKAFLLTLTVLLAVIRENNGKLAVLQLPRYPLVYVGDDITLKCEGAVEPITWKINGTEQLNTKSTMVLMMVTPENNGKYTCEKNKEESEPLILTVLVLEPHAQLSLPIGGAVITKGEARILTLQVDEELDKWKCFAFRNNVGYKLPVTKKPMNMGTVYADLQDTERATFWCMKNKTKHRSNALTLKMTERLVMLEPPVAPVWRDETITLRCAVWGGAEVTHADFFKDNEKLKITTKTDEYEITNATESNNGEYKCIATYRYSHISSAAAKHSHESDPQELKVIGGPPVAVLVKIKKNLQCSCPRCESVCRTYEWYHTNNSGNRTKLQETKYEIHPTVGGSYICRAACQDGFSRFSTTHVYKTGPSGGVPILLIILAILLFLGVLIIILLLWWKWKHRRGVQSLERGKDDKMKDKSGADYEQLALTDKAEYHTLNEAKGQAKEEGEGGYEALKKTEDKGVYHTLKAGEGSGEGGYEALKKTEDKAVYHTLKAGEGSGEGSSQGQGGYEALQNVKAQVYQTLSSDGSGKPKEEAEGGYEQLPQKIGDPQDVKVEENPYEELKASKVEKKESTLEKE